LASKWLDNFEGLPNFKGILVREDMPSDRILQQRESFHARYVGQKQLTNEMHRKLGKLLYPELDDTERALINLFGVPKYSTTQYSKTIFLSSDINGVYAKNWLTKTCKDASPLFFTVLNQILKPWWIEITKSHLLNCHLAVLPYARGMNCIENLAIIKDINEFKKAAGATIHYIDEGVDTGPIIRAEKIVEPFCFNSIWELKGYTYIIGFDLFVKTAKDIISNTETFPAGVTPNLLGPQFFDKDFTQDKRKQAEEGYLSMKHSLIKY
jgi:phosphoribosylglycinamide formyltransferase-1